MSQPRRANALLAAGALGSSSAAPSYDAVDEEDEVNEVDDQQRAERFAATLEGNTFRKLEHARIQQRKDAIEAGLIADPDKRTSLEHAIEFRGTCEEMCPEFERQEREFKKNVHPLEQLDGQPGRIDPKKAVTIYHRSAAGIEQPLPSDIRTPATLKRTLDYLLHDVVKTPPPDVSNPSAVDCLKYTHHFIRDRTRGIRQDFTYQKQVGIAENIECHERIARFHILAIHELGDKMESNFLQQETEQLNKTLISLIELYDDQRLEGRTFPHEPEFRAYHLVSHLNDVDVARSVLDLPFDTFQHPLVQAAFDLRALVQRNFDSQKNGSKFNTEMGLNFASRFFKMVDSDRIPFLLACLAHAKFGDVRRACLRAATRAFPKVPGGQVNAARVLAAETARKMLGCQSLDELVITAEILGLEVVFSDDDEPEPLGVAVNMGSDFKDNADPPFAEVPPSMQSKRRGRSYQDIVDTPAVKVSRPSFAPPPQPAIQRFPPPPVARLPAPMPAFNTQPLVPFPLVAPPVPVPAPQQPVSSLPPPRKRPAEAPTPLPLPKTQPRPAPRTLSAKAKAKMASEIALEALQAQYSTRVHEISVEAYQAEERRRKQLHARRQQHRSQKIELVAQGIVAELARALQTTAVAEAALAELQQRSQQRAIFSRWQGLTEKRVEARDRQRRRREAFQAATRAMRLVPKDLDTDVAMDAETDLGSIPVDERFSVAAAIQKRSLMERETFWDVTCDHFVHIAALETGIELDVSLCTSETAQGYWLRRKFGLDDDNVAGYQCDAFSLSGNLYPREKSHKNTALCVFEWNEARESLARLQRLVQDLPSRRDYKMALCIIAWNPHVQIPSHIAQHFSSHSVSDLSRDASDQAFESALEDALPSLEKVEWAQANVKMLVDNLVPHLTTILATVKAVVDKSDANLSAARSALDRYLEALFTLQSTVCITFPALCNLSALDMVPLPTLEDGTWHDRSDAIRALTDLARRWPLPGQLDNVQHQLATDAGPISHLILVFIHAISERLYDHLTSHNFDFLISQSAELDRGAASAAADFANSAQRLCNWIAELIPQALEPINQNTLNETRSSARKRSFESSVESSTLHAVPPTDAVDRKTKLRRAIVEAQRAIAT